EGRDGRALRSHSAAGKTGPDAASGSGLLQGNLTAPPGIRMRGQEGAQRARPSCPRQRGPEMSHLLRACDFDRQWPARYGGRSIETRALRRSIVHLAAVLLLLAGAVRAQ